MNSSKIDVNYAQTGNICVFSSYAIIMNYFSKNRKNICELIDRYIQEFQTNPASNTILDKENSVHQHYHRYCHANNLRGFQFIASRHKMNLFSTLRYSVPVNVAVNAGNLPLNRGHNIMLKRKLRKGGLAMILLHNTPPTNGFHAIVIGFDKHKGGYFYRNPTRNNGQVLVWVDFLKNNDIFEYILFERFKKNIKHIRHL
ncbi:MAG: hypothetical protein IPH93_17665 [Saprospiraceae bacterium]|nr:hypothetical protein [Saprospiraceae bacterium]MBK7809763.1 hypothetical protein [Saprospiraceae bacterium]MBK9632126.1 hypothetical protein [Saprospiraceae bacterium]